MAYVAPNSTIKLLARLPLTNTYEDTVWYATASDQLADMNDHVKVQLTQYSYQRHGRDYIRVTIPNVNTQNPTPDDNVADRLFDVNYMMFQNTNFGNKWFYAFVTDIEYINNSCAELKYEIDVIQTFMFDYYMPEVYIEREHSATDVAGDNVVEENINIGDLVPYKGQKYELSYDFSSITVYIMYIYNRGALGVLDSGSTYFWNQNFPFTGGYIRNNIYSGVEFQPVSGNITTQSNIDALVRRIKTSIDAIIETKCTLIGMIALPDGMFGSKNFFRQSTNRIPLNYTNLQVPSNISGYVDRPTSFSFKHDPADNYVPKNNKLFTYPFNQIKISNREGVYKTYKYEYFDDPTTPLIGLSYIASPEFECSVFPRNYMYSREGTTYIPELNPDLFVAGAAMPTPTFTEDTYNLWKAQKASSMGIDVLGNILKGAITGLAAYYSGGTSTALMAGLGTAAVGSASTIISANLSARQAPDVFHGSQCSGELLTGMNIKGFDIEQLQIRPTLAKQIDDYFTKYGYACKQIKRPNIFTANRRPYWNYVKTLGCHVHPMLDYSGHTFSGIPMDYMNKINTIWDNGIRFWMDGLDSVDQYTQDNSPA